MNSYAKLISQANMPRYRYFIFLLLLICNLLQHEIPEYPVKNYKPLILNHRDDVSFIRFLNGSLRVKYTFCQWTNASYQ